MKLLKAFNLKEYSSIKLGPTKCEAVVLEKKEDIVEALEIAEKKHLLPLFIGSATNSIFGENIDKKYLFIISDLKKISIDGERIIFESGILWDDAVKFSVDHDLSGIETLSAIPGTVGAGPVQNIGAYGSELKDYFDFAEVFDVEKKKFRIFKKKDCHFAYRSSIFKEQKGRFFIVAVGLKLSDVTKKSPKIPQYKDVQKYFLEKKNSAPTPLQIRKAIIEIRAQKLPNVKDTPNLGSYFKNPSVSPTEFAKIQKNNLAGEIPNFQNLDGTVKLFAGWLIEQSGFKNKFDENSQFGTYAKNPIILIGDKKNKNGNAENILDFEQKIRDAVEAKFGIKLEREPNLIV